MVLVGSTCMQRSGSRNVDVRSKGINAGNANRGVLSCISSLFGCHLLLVEELGGIIYFKKKDAKSLFLFVAVSLVSFASSSDL